MLILVFHVGDDRYGLDTNQVVEVIPRVQLRKLHHAPAYAAGTFNHRGSIVPTIDLCHLIQGQASRACLSTRIAIANYPDSDGRPRLLGLMAERITETLDRTRAVVADSRFHLETASFLGETIVDELGEVQCIRLDRLLSIVQPVQELMAQAAMMPRLDMPQIDRDQFDRDQLNRLDRSDRTGRIGSHREDKP